MADKISDNVGKKIVEALKMQNQPAEEDTFIADEPIESEIIENHDDISDDKTEEDSREVTPVEAHDNETEEISLDISSILNNNSTSDIDNIFQNTLSQNLNGIDVSEVKADFDYPNNVAMLTHLIAKLPAGVSKQTGALIIRQTIEALGIPMKSVIKEAQQVQQALTSRARECQKNIIDYKKQIATLEIKGQQYQKQAVSMNDIINLFLNTGV